MAWSRWKAGDPLTSQKMNEDHDDSGAIGTAAALSALQSARDLAACVIVNQQKQSTTYGDYSVTRIRTHGKFVPGLVGKEFSNNYQNQGTTGADFIPDGEFLDSYALRLGATFVSNASGWNVTSNYGEMRGVQIRNGIIYHDFDNFSGSPAGREAIALMSDGRLRCFSRERGDTAASMVAAGVVHSWCYGPNLVVNGVKQDIDANPTLWKYFSKNYSPVEISCRTIIGQSSGGDIIVINTVGKTNQVGITGNDMVDLAALEGCYNASTFDGGGSTQGYLGGYYVVPSSDMAADPSHDGVDKKRKTGDAFIAFAQIAARPIDTGWKVLPLASGFQAASSSQVPSIRQIGGMVYFRGAVSRTSGNFDSSDYTVLTIPQRYLGFGLPARPFSVPGNGTNVRKAIVQANGTVTILGDANSSPVSVSLDPLNYPVD